MSDIDSPHEFPIVYDVTIDGGVDKSGNINQVWNKDALMNAIRMWFASFEGEGIRRPLDGGYLAAMLMRPMNQVSAEEFKMILRNGFDEDFRPLMVIRTLEIQPNYEKRYWRIYMELYSPDLKINATVNERIRAQV